MTHVATVTIDSAQVPSDQTDFVVWIKLADLGSAFWSTVANGGGDIRCYKSDGTTELARDVVSCDTSTEVGELHVKYTGTLSSSADTDIQIHADGASSDYAVGATYGRNAVWSDYEHVFHCNESSPASGLTDATGNLDLGSNYGTPTAVTNSVLGGEAVQFGANVAMYQNDAGVFNSDRTMIQAIARTTSGITGNNVLGQVADKDIGSRFVSLHIHDDGSTMECRGFKHSYLPAAATNSAVTSEGLSDSDTDWHWFTMWIDDPASDFNSHAQLDNGTVASDTSGSNYGPESYNVHDRLVVGNRLMDSSPGGGSDTIQIDEIRFRSTLLSADWLTTEYNNQSDPATFYSVTDIGGATTLVAADLTHSHTIDAGALTQAHTLAGDDLTIGHSLDAGVLTQGYSLTGQALDQSQSIDNAVLTQAHVLVAAELLHGHTIDSGALTVAGALAGDDLSQTQALDLGALTQHNVLSGQDLSQGQTIDNAVLVVAGALNANPLTQSQIIEAAALVQNYVLSGQDLTQSQEIDSGVLSTGIDLTAQDLAHAQTIDAGALTQYHVLTADSLTQAQILQAASLGGVVIGELEGEIVIYAAIGGDVYTFPALAGTVH